MTALLWILGIALYLFIGGMVAQWLEPDGEDNAIVAFGWLPVVLLAVPYRFCRGCITLGGKLVDKIRRPHD